MKYFCNLLIIVPELVLQGVYDSVIANVMVASGEIVGDAARCTGDLAGKVVTGACDMAKEVCPRAVLDCRPLTPNGKTETALRWY